MKKTFFIFLLTLYTYPAFSESILVRVCKNIASNAKGIAEQKKEGQSEMQIRNQIFEKNSELKRDKQLKNDFIDSITEQEMDFLIWVFAKKNENLSPDQVYSVKFNECFKDLRSKGYK